MQISFCTVDSPSLSSYSPEITPPHLSHLSIQSELYQGFVKLYQNGKAREKSALAKDRMMMELHAREKTLDDIANVLKRVAINPHIVAAIKTANALGRDLRILSDANIFFIETVLIHFGLRYCFSEINPNPSRIDEQERLRVEPYHSSLFSPHGCKFCPPNLCNGLVIARIQASLSTEGKKFIYLGDGPGVFCPSIKLRQEDYVMPRKDFPVWDLICKNRRLIKAQVHEWSNGEDFERIIVHLINKISIKNSNMMLSVDRKLDTVPIFGHKLFNQALPVRH